jgi:hypothetical protein
VGEHRRYRAGLRVGNHHHRRAVFGMGLEGYAMNTNLLREIAWRIRHPILALRHWRTMRDAERRFGPFPPSF